MSQKNDYKEVSDRERNISSRPGAIILASLAIIISLILLAEINYDLIPFFSIADPSGDIVKLLVALIIIAIAWLLLYYVGQLFEEITLPKIESHAQIRSTWKLITYVIWTFLLVTIILSLIGDVGSLVVYFGLIGAALTFVLQKPLLNLAGWALITYRRLFKIGDRIAIGGAKGYVLDIRTMYSELREFGEWMKGDTFTGRIVSIPNSIVFDQPVFNYTRDFPFIWDEVGNLVTYESDIEVAKKYMLDAANEVVGELMEKNYEKYRHKLGIRDLEHLLLKKPELRMELSDSGVNIYVLYFCPVERRRALRSEITDRIWKKFMADPRVGIAYPHMQLVGKVDH